MNNGRNPESQLIQKQNRYIRQLEEQLTVYLFPHLVKSNFSRDEMNGFRDAGIDRVNFIVYNNS